MWNIFRFEITGSQRIYLADVTGKTANLPGDLVHGQDTVISEGRRSSQDTGPVASNALLHTYILCSKSLNSVSLPAVPFLRPPRAERIRNSGRSSFAITSATSTYPLLLTTGSTNHRPLALAL